VHGKTVPKQSIDSNAPNLPDCEANPDKTISNEFEVPVGLNMPDTRLATVSSKVEFIILVIDIGHSHRHWSCSLSQCALNDRARDIDGGDYYSSIWIAPHPIYPTTTMGMQARPKLSKAAPPAKSKHEEGALSREFSENEMVDFRAAFNMFDLDASGTIETHELKEVLTQLGEAPSDEDIQEMIILVDENKDGVVDFDEFITLMRLRMGDSGEDAEHNLKDVFDIFDADGSGFIDRKEMGSLMKKLAQSLSEDEITAIMEEVDIDGDGEVSFEEFKNLMIK
jgi:Ca2+-binding EF-hand superfamily protein